MTINQSKQFCYRIAHIDNLPLILRDGLVSKKQINYNDQYINIGNPSIIDVRSTTEVKLPDYHTIGDYVPFYFTPKSIMLLNIQTGYQSPLVIKRHPSEIIVLRCRIKKLIELPKWFFTNGQANTFITEHYNDIKFLDQIDWITIQNCDFKKTLADNDKPRRYQAEFLVQNHVPIEYIDSIYTYDEVAKNRVCKALEEYKKELIVGVQKLYYF